VISKQTSPFVTVEPEQIDLPRVPRPVVTRDTLDPPSAAELDALPTDQFEALIRLGQARGGLTQDDLMSVLRSV
jgi:hypothetical protein